MALLAILTAFVLVLAWAWFTHEVSKGNAVHDPPLSAAMLRLSAAMQQATRVTVPLTTSRRGAMEGVARAAKQMERLRRSLHEAGVAVDIATKRERP
jgi:hypothetical protein